MDTEESNQKLWRTLLIVSLSYLVVGSFWFQPWYVLWIIAPAALLPESPFTRSVLPWLVFGALSSNAAMDFLMNSVMKTSPPLFNYILSVVIIWGFALLAASVFSVAQIRKKVRPANTLPSMKLANH
jgi:hypothetical protein